MWCYLRPHWVCYLMSGIYLHCFSKIQTILNSKTYIVTKFVGKAWWVCDLLGHNLAFGYQTVLLNVPQIKEEKEGPWKLDTQSRVSRAPLIILLSPHFHISSLGSMLLSASNLLNSGATSSYTNFLCQHFRILFWFCNSFFLTSIFLMTVDLDPLSPGSPTPDPLFLPSNFGAALSLWGHYIFNLYIPLSFFPLIFKFTSKIGILK